jgi:predicted nucleic acid-binding Zn ribbon protein
VTDDLEPTAPAAAPEPEVKGIDLARRALEEARAAAKASGKSVGQGRRSGTGVRALRARRRRGWSGPGPDDRDPQPFGALTNAIAKQRGWSPKVSEGTVLGRWVQVVGEDIAAHAEPTGLRDGILSVSAESTAWATQLRMMQSQILAKIAAAVGDGVVKSLRITGPTAPSWRKGERHIRGRGPRDTYG